MATYLIEHQGPRQSTVIRVGTQAGPAGADGSAGKHALFHFQGEWDDQEAGYTDRSDGDGTEPPDQVRGSDGALYNAAAVSIPANTDPTLDDGTYWTLYLEPGTAGGGGSGLPGGGVSGQIVAKLPGGDAFANPPLTTVTQASPGSPLIDGLTGATVTTVRPPATTVLWLLHDRPDGSVPIDASADLVANISGSVW